MTSDGPTPNALPSRDVLKVLGDNTRYGIYLELARAARPLVTAEIAETLGLHPNTVRPHLERMREVGLLEVTTDARGEVGRPQHRYSLAPDAPSLGLEPPTVPLLARMVLAMAERLDASADDAAAVGEGRGRPAPRATPTRHRRSRRSSPTSTALASTPSSPPMSSTRPTSAIVAFANCPFAAFAATHPELVCGLHRGLVAGFVAAMGDAEVREFCPLAHRTPCQVSIGPVAVV